MHLCFLKLTVHETDVVFKQFTTLPSAGIQPKKFAPRSLTSLFMVSAGVVNAIAADVLTLTVCITTTAATRGTSMRLQNLVFLSNCFGLHPNDEDSTHHYGLCNYS